MPARERWYAGPLTPRALDQQQTHGCQDPPVGCEYEDGWCPQRSRPRQTRPQRARPRRSRPWRHRLFAYFDHASADLHHALSTTSPGTPAWTWCQDETVWFIRRRQAHEALIHRIDAELTAGDRTPMDTDLSADGVDEALHFMDAGLRSWGASSTSRRRRSGSRRPTPTIPGW